MNSLPRKLRFDPLQLQLQTHMGLAHLLLGNKKILIMNSRKLRIGKFHITHATNPSLWNFVPFLDVNTFAGRSNWIRPMLEAAQELTDDDLSPTIQQLHRILLRNGFVRPMSPAVLRPFVTALMVNQLPTSEVVENGFSYQRDGVNLWIFRMRGLPGPTFADNVPSDAKYYHWFHACTAATIMGICRTGYLLPTCNDGIQFPTTIPLFGFCGKVCTMDAQDYDKLTQQTFAMRSRAKNSLGITASGGVLGHHAKIPRASTWLEQFLCIRSGLVRSAANDKRWCIRCDRAVTVPRFNLLHFPAKQAK